MVVKNVKLLVSLVVLASLTFMAVPFLATRGVSWDVSNQYGEPIEGALCDLYGFSGGDADSTYGRDESNVNGYCVIETPDLPDDLYSYTITCPSNNRRVSGSAQVWSLGIRNYDIVLQDCVSGYQAPTTTLSPYCTENGVIPSPLLASQCCSGCISTSAYNYECKACGGVTTVRTTVATSFHPTTTLKPTSCSSPYGNSGAVSCFGDVKKQCTCGVTCQWLTVGVCGGDDTSPDTTLPPTGGCSSPYGSQGSVICSALDQLTCNCYDGVCGWYRTGACGGVTSTTLCSGSGCGGGAPDLTVILIVGGVGLAGVILLTRKKK